MTNRFMTLTCILKFPYYRCRGKTAKENTGTKQLKDKKAKNEIIWQDHNG